MGACVQIGADGVGESHQRQVAAKLLGLGAGRKAQVTVSLRPRLANTRRL